MSSSSTLLLNTSTPEWLQFHHGPRGHASFLNTLFSQAHFIFGLNIAQTLTRLGFKHLIPPAVVTQNLSVGFLNLGLCRD